MARAIELKEWESVTVRDLELSTEDRNTVKLLNDKRIIEIQELKEGITIKSNSYVGRIQLGSLQINVYPKLNGLPLYQLLNFAYGLRELKLLNMAQHSIDNYSFFDLLIYELYVETEDLLLRGLQRSYMKKEESLITPRGRIDITKFCTQGGLIKETLPCVYFNRDENNMLNQMLLAGINLGIKLVQDRSLKVRLLRLSVTLEQSITKLTLTRGNLQLAKNNINRLTGRYSTLLEIVNILFESQGIKLEDGSNYVNLRGYFFDMNAFFETLVSQLLVNYTEGYSVKVQFNLHDLFIYNSGFNPRSRKSPTPRPDFALMKQGKVVKLMDAKYRDLWEKNLPREMLYQLAIYAVSGIGDRTATILYPAMNNVPSIQKIDVTDPITNSKMATVILKPINLIRLAEIVGAKGDLGEFVDGVVG